MKKNHLLIYPIIAFGWLFVIWVFIYDYKQSIKFHQQYDLDILQSTYNYTVKSYEHTSMLFFKNIINTDRNLELLDLAFKNKKEQGVIRQKIYSNIEYEFKNFTNAGFLNLTLVDTKGNVFLRMADKESFGDKLSTSRALLQKTLQSGKYNSGFEIGKLYVGNSFCYPLKLNNKLIGAVVVTVSTKKLIERMNENFTGKFDFIVSKKLLQKNIPQEKLKRYKQSYISKEFASDDLAENENIIISTNKSINTSELLCATPHVAHTQTKEFGEVGVSSLPVKNSDGNIGAYFMYYKTDLAPNGLLQSLLMKLFVVTSLFAVIVFLATRQDKLFIRATKNDTYYKMLFERAAIGLYHLSLDGNFLKANKKLCETLGYSEDELLKKNFRNITYDADLKESIENVNALINREIESYTYDKRYIKKSGEPIWVRVSNVMVDDRDGSNPYFVGTVEDINEEMKAKNMLKLQKEQMDAILEELPSMVIIKDNQFRYNFVNQAICDFLQKSKEELIGKTIMDLLPIESAEQIWENEKNIVETQIAQTLEETITDARGRVSTLLVTKKPFSTFGGKNGLLVVLTDITDRKEMENKIANSEARYKAISERSIAGLYVVQDGKMSYVNEAYAKMLGYNSADEIIGKISVETLVAPKDREKAVDLLRKRFDGEIKDAKYTATLIQKNGSEIVVEAHGTVGIYDGRPAIIGVIIDRTAEKKLEDELKESEEKFRKMFENSYDAIILQDGNCFIDCNQKALELFGASDKKELLHCRPEDFSSDHQYNNEDAAFAADKQIQEANKAGSSHFEWLSRRINGEVFPSDVLLSTFEHNGKQIIQATVRDLTRVKADQKKIEEQERMIAAQSRFAAMGEMIGMIAHQWRQPITAIGMGANNMILDIELGDIQPDIFKKHLESINTQVQFLSGTIDDFRNFFKPNKETVAIDIATLIEESLKIIGKSLENNNIKVRKELSYNPRIKAYKSELIQVLLAIIGNAKDAMLEREIQNPTVTFTTIQSPEFEGHIELHICDNGGGVQDEIRDKIFEPYFTTKSAKNGTGLGLYIAKTIVQKHEGGSIGVRNENDGACFWIRLPLTKTGEA